MCRSAVIVLQTGEGISNLGCFLQLHDNTAVPLLVNMREREQTMISCERLSYASKESSCISRVVSAQSSKEKMAHAKFSGANFHIGTYNVHLCIPLHYFLTDNQVKRESGVTLRLLLKCFIAYSCMEQICRAVFPKERA